MRPRIAVLALALAAGPSVAAEIELDRGPVRGRELVVRVSSGGAPLAGATVTATYGPRSRVASREVIGRTGRDGTLGWRPRAAGLVRLEASREGGGSRGPVDVGVRYPVPPPSGLVTLILAAAVLAGGLVAGLRRRRRTKEL